MWSGGWNKKQTVLIVALWLLYLPFGLIGLIWEVITKKAASKS
ncbi:hypothetical protein OB997_26525 [Bacillus cereus]|nr:hypothetical protein [Bacillus cereus]